MDHYECKTCGSAYDKECDPKLHREAFIDRGDALQSIQKNYLYIEAKQPQELKMSVLHNPNNFHPVQKPSHYNKSGIECIDALEASMTREEFEGHLKGNVLKYIWRYKYKNGMQDLEKALWYLKKLIVTYGKDRQPETQASIESQKGQTNKA